MYVLFALLLRDSAPTLDEVVHYWQINQFDHGKFVIAKDYLTMLPGYHAVVAAILWVTDQRTSMASARLATALLGVFTIWAFRLLRKGVWPEEYQLATLQFALLPILFPYNFLVYTDVASLGLMLAATAMAVRSRHVVAGALLIAAMCVRQTNVVWAPLLVGLALGQVDLRNPPPLRTVVARAWPYAVGVAAFLAYWKWNGHISLSTEQSTMHPDLSVHVDNLYFALFMCALFFPIHVVLGLREFAARVAERRWLILLPLLAIALGLLLLRLDHPYNRTQTPLLLHNHLIALVATNLACKIAFVVIAVIAACGLACTRLRRANSWLIYPCTAVALCAFWMVEHRYALISIALWLAFRETRSRKVELLTTALWLIFAVYFGLGIWSNWFTL